jgi:hypothetical protein
LLGVALSGVAGETHSGSRDPALPAGSYSFQKDGEWPTKCTSLNECPFFISQTGKFDYVPDSKP